MRNSHVHSNNKEWQILCLRNGNFTFALLFKQNGYSIKIFTKFIIYSYNNITMSIKRII